MFIPYLRMHVPVSFHLPGTIVLSSQYRDPKFPHDETPRAQRRCLPYHPHHRASTSLVPILSARVSRTATFSQIRKGSGAEALCQGTCAFILVIEVRAMLLLPSCAERGSPRATTLWPWARLHGRLLSLFPFEIR